MTLNSEYYLKGSELQVRGAFTDLDAPLDFIPLHILGGHILPTQQPANSTAWRCAPRYNLYICDINNTSGCFFIVFIASIDLRWECVK